MKTSVGKSKRDGQSRAVANQGREQGKGSNAAFHFDDNRSEAIQHRKLQSMADNSPQAANAAQLKAMADNGSRFVTQRLFDKPVQLAGQEEEEKEENRAPKPPRPPRPPRRPR